MRRFVLAALLGALALAGVHANQWQDRGEQESDSEQYAQTESGVDMVDVPLVANLEHAIHDLAPRDVKLTKFERHLAQEMGLAEAVAARDQELALIEMQEKSETEAVVVIHHQSDSDTKDAVQADAEAETAAKEHAEELADTSAELQEQIDAEAEHTAAADADADAASKEHAQELADTTEELQEHIAAEAEDAAAADAEAQAEALAAQEADADAAAAMQDAAAAAAPAAKAAAPRSLLAKKSSARVQEEPATPATIDVPATAAPTAAPTDAPASGPKMVRPKIVFGTKGLPEAPRRPHDKTLSHLPDCPKKEHHHRHRHHHSLVEVDAAVDEPSSKIDQRVHVHVKTMTKSEGGQNLVRVEQRFERLHDKVMGRLNKLMSRIKRHPESIEDKRASYAYTT